MSVAVKSIVPINTDKAIVKECLTKEAAVYMAEMRYL